MNVHPKVAAAATGATMAGSATLVLVWMLADFAKVTVPADVAASITTLLSGAAAFLSGYFISGNPPQPSPPAAGQ